MKMMVHAYVCIMLSRLQRLIGLAHATSLTRAILCTQYYRRLTLHYSLCLAEAIAHEGPYSCQVGSTQCEPEILTQTSIPSSGESPVFVV
ncbi:hypothetical protein F5Y12DRAFT_739694, partial [Xylaria sp. FL1777]